MTPLGKILRKPHFILYTFVTRQFACLSTISPTLFLSREAEAFFSKKFGSWYFHFLRICQHGLLFLDALFLQNGLQSALFQIVSRQFKYSEYMSLEVHKSFEVDFSL